MKKYIWILILLGAGVLAYVSFYKCSAEPSQDAPYEIVPDSE
jgi:hypothetical protein